MIGEAVFKPVLSSSAVGGVAASDSQLVAIDFRLDGAVNVAQQIPNIDVNLIPSGFDKVEFLGLTGKADSGASVAAGTAQVSVYSRSK